MLSRIWGFIAFTSWAIPCISIVVTALTGIPFAVWAISVHYPVFPFILRYGYAIFVVMNVITADTISLDITTMNAFVLSAIISFALKSAKTIRFGFGLSHLEASYNVVIAKISNKVTIKKRNRSQ